jgi:hypothetical protein
MKAVKGTYQHGHVILDQPADWPEGTPVLVQAVTVEEMAQAWERFGRPAPEDDAALTVDPDDYPFF